jgi:hypothetical protein
MYGLHICNEYIKGLDAFMDFMKKDMLDNVNETDILGFTDDDIEFWVHNIEEMVRNVKRHGDDYQYSNGELAKYKKMITDSKKPFYHGYVAQYTRLFTMVKLFQLKASNRWSNCSFKDLLTLLKDMLPQGNTVPKTVYEAKQIICSLGLEVETIHVCKNDCILYRGPEYKDHEKCPICGLDRFNHRKDGGDDKNYNRNRRKCGLKRCFGIFQSFLI